MERAGDGGRQVAEHGVDPVEGGDLLGLLGRACGDDGLVPAAGPGHGSKAGEAVDPSHNLRFAT